MTTAIRDAFRLARVFLRHDKRRPRCRKPRIGRYLALRPRGKHRSSVRTRKLLAGNELREAR